MDKSNASFKEKLHNFLCPIFRNIRKKVSPNPWVTYEELESLYNTLKNKENIDKNLLQVLEKYLKLAKDEFCSLFFNYIYFWKVLHRAKVESLMLIDKEDFKIEAINIINQFDNIVDDDHLKKVWLGTDWDITHLNKILNNEPIDVDGILTRSLKIFVSNPTISNEDEYKIRTNFKNALKLLYDYFVDGNIYKLSLTYLYINYSLILFLIIFVVFFRFYIEEILSKFSKVLLPGFLGALIGNIITYRENLPKGIFLLAIRGIIFRPFVFHVIGKGVIGAFAAYLIYKASEAGILFSLKDLSPDLKNSLVVVLSFVAGFSGIALVDKFVSSVLEKITSKLEKSRGEKRKK